MGINGSAKRSSRVSKACERCRKKKVKCDNMKPCFNCTGSHLRCTYRNERFQSSEAFIKYIGSVSNDLNDVKYTISKLKTQLSPGAPASLQKGLMTICSELEKIQPQLYLNLDSKEIASYKGTESIETKIIGQHSRFLNIFSNCFESNTAHTVNTYFGVYSPLLYFTSTGISWITKKLISYSDDRGTRETIYLFLKFIDASSASHEASPKVTSISPLEYYAKLNGLHCGNNELIQHIVSEIASNNNASTKIFESFCPDNPRNGLMYAIRLMEEHHKILNCKSLSLLGLKEFLEQDELIFCLCIEYFERSIFSPMNDPAIIEGLISLVKHRYWIDDCFALGRIICAMARRCLDAGLNRWEYYISQDEATSERHRNFWWDCFWWDRWYALVTGKQPLIAGDTTSCLFPKKVIGMGVDDSMDCLTLIDVVELDPARIDIFVSFGYILLAKIITTVFIGLLYNRKFTDYRLFAMPDRKDLSGTARQIKEKFLNISEIFQHVQGKLTPFLKEHFDDSRMFELYLHFGFTQVCCFQGIESLLSRIQNLLQLNEQTDVNICIRQSRLQNFETSGDILANILNQKDTFHIFKCSWFIYAILMNITSYFVENPKKHPVYFLSLMCGVIGLYNDFLMAYTNIDFKGHNKFYEKLGNGTAVSFILTRICCQVYMRSERISNELLLDQLKKFDRAYSDAGQAVLDIECVWYKNIIGDYKESNFRKEILNILEKKMDDLESTKTIEEEGNNDSVPSRGKVPSSSTSAPISMDFGSLENFVSSDSLPDFLNLLWEDIDLEISEGN